jgi:superfamily II DNA helicase RecQ
VKATAPAGPVDDALFDALKEWRRRASGGKPAYTVAHNSTLEAIAALRPATSAELAEIKGVGPTFVSRHGDQILALIAHWRAESADSARRPATVDRGGMPI